MHAKPIIFCLFKKLFEQSVCKTDRTGSARYIKYLVKKFVDELNVNGQGYTVIIYSIHSCNEEAKATKKDQNRHEHKTKIVAKDQSFHSLPITTIYDEKNK